MKVLKNLNFFGVEVKFFSSLHKVGILDLKCYLDKWIKKNNVCK